MAIIINPGTGKVEGSQQQALANIGTLLQDSGVDAVKITFAGRLDNGRYSFVLTHDGREAEVDMPGLPLDQVRFTNAPEQNIWHFPRLYVNGSSWVWCYAVGMLHSALLGEED